MLLFMCPEAFQIPADMPKRGEGGGQSGKIRKGEWRTVQQVILDLVHYKSVDPIRLKVSGTEGGYTLRGC